MRNKDINSNEPTQIRAAIRLSNFDQNSQQIFYQKITEMLTLNVWNWSNSKGMKSQQKQ